MSTLNCSPFESDYVLFILCILVLFLVVSIHCGLLGGEYSELLTF